MKTKKNYWFYFWFFWLVIRGLLGYVSRIRCLWLKIPKRRYSTRKQQQQQQYRQHISFRLWNRTIYTNQNNNNNSSNSNTGEQREKKIIPSWIFRIFDLQIKELKAKNEIHFYYAVKQNLILLYIFSVVREKTAFYVKWKKNGFVWFTKKNIFKKRVFILPKWGDIYLFELLLLFAQSLQIDPHNGSIEIDQ